MNSVRSSLLHSYASKKSRTVAQIEEFEFSLKPNNLTTISRRDLQEKLDKYLWNDKMFEIKVAGQK